MWISLGDGDEKTDVAVDLLTPIGHEASEAGLLEIWDDLSYHGHRGSPLPRDPEKQPALRILLKVLDCIEMREPGFFRATENLLCRPNWSRAWILQELALTKNGQILCGRKGISLDTFHAAITSIYLGKVSPFARQQPQWKNFGSGFTNNLFRSHGLLSRLKQLQGFAPTLLEILLSDFMGTTPERAHYDASDPRDIVFALLGIASDANVLGIRPDYRKTVAQVYTETTKALIIHCPDYRLEYCSFPKRIVELPSWVPDWQQIGQKGVCRPLSYRDCFTASQGRAQPTPMQTNSATLRRTGIVVDQVARVFHLEQASPAENCHDEHMRLANCLRSPADQNSCLESIWDFAEPFITGGTTESDLWRVLLAGEIDSADKSPEFVKLAHRAFRPTTVTDKSINESELNFMLRNLYPWPRVLEDNENIQELSDWFCERVVGMASAMARGRTLFVTTGGTFGLGPYHIGEGDAVTIVFGTQVPLILRPTGAAYEFVGDAYVHGMMKGECMNGGHEDVDFDLI